MQSVFIWRCTSSNNARTIITAFLVSSRSPVLLADDTSGIVRSIPKAVTITACIADFHAIEHHKYKKLYQNNGLKYSRILCVIVKDCGRNRTAQKSNAATAKGRNCRPKCFLVFPQKVKAYQARFSRNQSAFASRLF